MRLKLLYAACIMLLEATTAGATSFPCERASTNLEKMVCTDATLSGTDDDLAVAFRQALQPLSESARTQVRHAEAAWVGWVQEVCDTRGAHAPHQGQPTSKDDQERCVRVRYNDRIEQLRELSTHGSGPTVYLVESFTHAACPAENTPSDDAESGPSSPHSMVFASQYSTYPQIDAPATTAGTCVPMQDRAR